MAAQTAYCVFKNSRTGPRGDLAVEYFINDILRTTYVFSGPGMPHRQCVERRISNIIPNQTIISATNKLESAICVICSLSRTPNTEFSVVLYMEDFVDQLPEVIPMQNLEVVEIYSRASGEQIGRWLNQLSSTPIKSIGIHAIDGRPITGLGNINWIKKAETLAVFGVLCDITDAQLREFECDCIDIKSALITTDGIRSHLRKVKRRDEANGETTGREVYCRVPTEERAAEVAKKIIPRHWPHEYIVKNGLNDHAGNIPMHQ